MKYLLYKKNYADNVSTNKERIEQRMYLLSFINMEQLKQDFIIQHLNAVVKLYRILYRYYTSNAFPPKIIS